MNLQYISDGQGNTTGVFIPINEWNLLKDKYKGIEDEEAMHVPQWHKDIVLQRMAKYQEDPTQALDFDAALEDINKDI